MIPKVKGLTTLFRNLYFELKETEPIKHLKKSNSNMVYLWGKRGNGKSIAVQSYLCEKKKQGVKCMYITMSNLFMDLYAIDLDRRVHYIRDMIRLYDLIVIDEIDKIKLTEWKEEMIFNLLDERVNFCKDTVLVGNSSPAELESKLGVNIVSRILGCGEVIENKGVLLR
jgi:DNA replication protein DnaC